MLKRNTYLKHIVYCLLFTAYCLPAFGQTVTPIYIGVTGNYSTMKSSPFWSISSSVGEPITTTASSGTLTLTQGFQQPEQAQCVIEADVDTTSNNPICAGEPVTLTFIDTAINNNTSGMFSYSWSPSSGLSSTTIPNPVATPTGTTTYTVIVSSSWCVSDTDVITITVNPKPTVTITPTPASATICSGQNITLTASASGGSSPYTYLWQSGSTSNQFIVVYPSVGTPTYMVSATDLLGCRGIKTVTVTVKPVPAIPTVTATPNSICSGQTLSLSATNILNNLSYAWNGPGGYTSSNQNPTISPITTTYTGTYSVTATLAGCTSPAGTVSVTVNPTPTVTITSTYPEICTGLLNNTTLTATSAGAVSYLWFPAPGGTTSSIVVSPQTTSTYTVVVENTTNGCKEMNTISINVKNNPYPKPVVNPVAPVYCMGDAILPFTVTNPDGAIGWFDAAGGVLSLGNPYYPPQNLSVGTSYGWVTQGTWGCFAEPTVISITINPTPTVTITTAPMTICSGTTVTLTSNATPANVTYSWSGPSSYSSTSQNPIITNAASGAYSVTATNGFGCKGTKTVIVTVSNISVDAGADQILCPGSTAQLEAIVSPNTNGVIYHWSPNVNDFDIPTPSVNPDSTSTYIVVVENEDNCRDKDTITVIVNRDLSADCKNICNGIYNGITPNGDGYNDAWWINGIGSFPDNRVSIFSRWGNKVWGRTGYDNKDVKWEGKSDKGEILPSGTYYYVIEIYRRNAKTITCSGWVEVTR